MGHEMSRSAVRLVTAREVAPSNIEGWEDLEREDSPAGPDALPEEFTAIDDGGNDAAAAARRTPLSGLDDDTLGELIQRVAGRDERALEQLYDATSARVQPAFSCALRFSRIKVMHIISRNTGRPDGCHRR